MYRSNDTPKGRQINGSLAILEVIAKKTISVSDKRQLSTQFVLLANYRQAKLHDVALISRPEFEACEANFIGSSLALAEV